MFEDAPQPIIHFGTKYRTVFVANFVLEIICKKRRLNYITIIFENWKLLFHLETYLTSKTKIKMNLWKIFFSTIAILNIVFHCKHYFIINERQLNQAYILI